MTEYPFIYICSHAGKIGNIRWVNSDTRQGYWGAWVTSIHAQTRTTWRACRCPELLFWRRLGVR
jgi:hypothetical protein